MKSPFKKHRVDLSVSLGYPFLRAFFELDVEGENLDPAAVTKLLGVKPTRSHRKGDEHPRRKILYDTGAWTLSSGEVRLDPSYGEKAFERWLVTVPARGEAFRKLSRRYRVTLRIVLYAQAYNSEFYLSPKVLAMLAKRGIRVMIDTYLSLDVIPDRG